METVKVDDVTFTTAPDGSVIRRAIAVHSLPALLLYGALELSFVGLAFVAGRALVGQREALNWVPIAISVAVGIFFGTMVYFIFRATQIPELRFNAVSRMVEAPTDRQAESVPYSELALIESERGSSRASGACRYSVRIVLKDDREIRLATVTGDEGDALARGKSLVKLLVAATGVRATGPLAEAPKPRTPAPPASKPRPPSSAAPAAAPQRMAPFTVPPSGPAREITAALTRLQKEGLPDSTLTLRPEGLGGAHIRITGQAKRPGLYAEAAGNTLLDAAAQLSSEKLQRFVTLGWMSPRRDSGYYYRQWMAIADDERGRIAEQLVRALTQIYGWDPDSHLEVELNLAGKASTPEDTPQP